MSCYFDKKSKQWVNEKKKKKTDNRISYGHSIPFFLILNSYQNLQIAHLSREQ